ncbi:integrating conjugative element protein [Actinobacillus pleuropneumoniae]|uniref:integrating conjugative element protein n=1 Tax=Actinobacillus pleuropneumoniae TaxID=715 RepID=UPI003B012425
MKYIINCIVRFMGYTMMFSSSMTVAKLNVIADFGGESAVRFYEPIQPVHSENAPRHPNAVPSAVSEEQMLPVVSHKWRVGKVSPQTVNLPGAIPLFLIGADDTSVNWLEAQREQLISMNATGLVINVQNMEQLTRLRQIVPSLTLMPASADSLADRLNIYHYPILITAEGITQ